MQLPRAWRTLKDLARDPLLARSGQTADQHRPIGFGDLRNALEHGFQPTVAPDQIVLLVVAEAGQQARAASVGTCPQHCQFAQPLVGVDGSGNGFEQGGEVGAVARREDPAGHGFSQQQCVYCVRTGEAAEQVITAHCWRHRTGQAAVAGGGVGARDRLGTGSPAGQLIEGDSRCWTVLRRRRFAGAVGQGPGDPLGVVPRPHQAARERPHHRDRCRHC